MKVNKQWLEDHGLAQEDIDEFRHPGPDIMGGAPGHGDDDVRDERDESIRTKRDLENDLTSSFLEGSGDVGDLIKELLASVDTQNKFFFEGADDLFGRSQGTQLDAPLEAFRDRRLGNIRGQNAEFFGRRGTEGSTASLNALQRSTGQFDDEFGVLQLNRQDEQFNQSFALRTAGLEKAQIPSAVLMQLLALITKQQATV